MRRIMVRISRISEREPFKISKSHISHGSNRGRTLRSGGRKASPLHVGKLHVSKNRPGSCLIAGLVFLLCGASILAAEPSTDSANAIPSRPRIGLVLAGGSAKGQARVGVLKVPEGAPCSDRLHRWYKHGSFQAPATLPESRLLICRALFQESTGSRWWEGLANAVCSLLNKSALA